MNNIYFSVNAQKKIDTLIRDGAERLHVLSDFDRTITTNRALTSWSALSKSGMMPKEYVDKRNALYAKYYPYEIDLIMDRNERSELLRTWFKAHLDLLIEYTVSKEKMIKVVSDAKLFELRPGGDALLRLLNKKNIPVVIISAGVGNFIEIFLEHYNLNLPNIHILSNFVDFDENGLATSSRYNVTIHPANKNEKGLSELVQPLIVGRQNTIILGDSPDDVLMSMHAPQGETLSIGFFEREIEQERQREKDRKVYQEVYDIVLENENDMSEAIKIISQL